MKPDPLVGQLRPQDGPRDLTRTLDLLVVGVAEEAAAIAFEARKAEQMGRVDAAQVISRRIDALGKLAALVRDREHLHRECGALDPKMIEVARNMFFEGVGEVAEEVLGPDQGSKFVALVEAKLKTSDP
jgi:hypothetical protein